MHEFRLSEYWLDPPDNPCSLCEFEDECEVTGVCVLNTDNDDYDSEYDDYRGE